MIINIPFQFPSQNRCLKSNTVGVSVLKQAKGMFKLIVDDFAVSCQRER